MQLIKRRDLETVQLPGRMVQTAIGKGALSSSTKMTMGWARYSEESGPMEPHHHAEEIVFILSAEDGWVRYGPARDRLEMRASLEAGMLLHIPALEWHVFEFGAGGHVDILFFYGQVDNIRPEDMDEISNR